jgi:hypothetical protein
MCMPKNAGAGDKGVERFIQTQLRLMRNLSTVDGDVE